MSAHPVAPTRSPPPAGDTGLGGAIRFNLVLPTARLGFGPLSFNPLEQAIGAPVADILESLMTGPVTQRPSQAGPAVDVYPLELPDGEGLTVPLGRWGELGFRNEAGLLVLTVPLPAKDWIQQRLSGSLVRGPDHLLSQDGASGVARFWVEIGSGLNVGFPLGVLGEIAVETSK
jgi:hypothetical protein